MGAVPAWLVEPAGVVKNLMRSDLPFGVRTAHTGANLSVGAEPLSTGRGTLSRFLKTHEAYHMSVTAYRSGPDRFLHLRSVPTTDVALRTFAEGLEQTRLSC